MKKSREKKRPVDVPRLKRPDVFCPRQLSLRNKKDWKDNSVKPGLMFGGFDRQAYRAVLTLRLTLSLPD